MAARRDIVLVVDDTPDTLGFLTAALEQAGLTALVANSGDSALKLLNHATPDLILLDAMMPGMDGFATCRAIKEDSAFAHLPIIFMTGLSDTEHVVQGLEAGGVDYVAKPIVVDELLARIRVHLANARIANRARLALDATGRYLLAATAAGELIWCTPQAEKRLAAAQPHRPGRIPLPPHRIRHRPGAGIFTPISLADHPRSRSAHLDCPGQIQPRHQRHPRHQPPYGQQTSGTGFYQTRGGKPCVSGSAGCAGVGNPCVTNRSHRPVPHQAPPAPDVDAGDRRHPRLPSKRRFHV
jgi:DNA-binding response OmpR family regulator